MYLFLTVSSTQLQMWGGLGLWLICSSLYLGDICWMNIYQDIYQAAPLPQSVLGVRDMKITKASFLPLRHSHKGSGKMDKSTGNGAFTHDSKRVLYKSSDINGIKSSLIFSSTKHWCGGWYGYLNALSVKEVSSKLVVLGSRRNQKFPLKHTVENERKWKRKGRPFRGLARWTLPEQSDPLCLWSKRSDLQTENQSPRVAG